MEVSTLLLAAIVACIVVMIILWARNREENHNLFKRYGIPGPEPSFWWGNLKDMKCKQTKNETITAWLKKYGDVFGYFLGEVPFVVVKDLEMLKQIFIKDFEIFCNRPLLMDIPPLSKTLIGLEDKRWKEVRSFLSPLFTSAKIRLMIDIVSRKVDIAVDVVTKKAQKSEAFDMYKVVQGLTLDVIADCALAMKTRCQDNSQDALLTSVQHYLHDAHTSSTDYELMFPAVACIKKFLNKFKTSQEVIDLTVSSVNRAIDERSKNPDVKSMDFLQLMLDRRENNEIATRLSNEDILHSVFLFILGGYESSSISLAFTFHLLAEHPEIQEKLYEEIKKANDDNYFTVQNLPYLNQVLTESLRLYPPLTGFITRECSEDYQIGSVTIPKGAVVEAPVWDIHHDPELWPDPWNFDPDRFSPENKASLNSMAYMAFGIGRRNCIAEKFALAEAKLAIFRLVKKFRFEACEKTNGLLSLICRSVMTFPAAGINLRAIPRTAAL